MKRLMLPAYAALALPLAVVGLPLTIYVPALYAQSRGVALGTISLVLLLARLADVVVDPAVGALSDRFGTPIGRRRPWIAVGIVLTVVGVRHVFDPPAQVGGLYLLGWIGVLYLGWSLVTIPYLAWGGGLSGDYNRRSLISGVREFAAMLGIVLAAVAPALSPGSLELPMRTLSHLVTWLLPAASLLLMVVVREPALPPAREAAGAWRALWRNGPFRLLMMATLLGGIGSAVNGALVIFYLQQMNLGDHKELLLLYLVSALAGIPLWVWLAARVGKHRALCYGSLWGCGWFALVPLIPPGAYWPVALVNVMAGCAIGASPVLGASMAADVIDWDALRTRRDRSALFFSLWSMATKATQALGILALPLVALLGFQVQGPVTAQARWALTIGYVAVPIGFWLGAIALLWNFPIDRRRQARIAVWRRSRQPLDLGAGL
jgi:GPH family glycoside/pentoside/hexuronide:cation symporter